MVKRRRGEDPAADAAASAAAEEARTACEEVIARITEHAAAKRLKAAAAAYAELAQRRLPDSLRARTALLHAHVNAGDRAGAWAQLEGIKAAGFTPNVVVFTALLKADSLAGDVRGARSTLDAMVGCRPRPVLPDTRAVNTFLRCCSRCGDTGAAVEIYARMADEWEVLPDATTYRLLSRLLAQALRLHEAQALATRHRESSVTQTAVEGAPAETGAGAGAVAHPPNQGTELVPGGASWEQKAAAKRAKKEWTKREKSAVPQCMFWQRGRCDRGNSCRFFHDPALAPQLVAELMLEKHGEHERARVLEREREREWNEEWRVLSVACARFRVRARAARTPTTQPNSSLLPSLRTPLPPSPAASAVAALGVAGACVAVTGTRRQTLCEISTSNPPFFWGDASCVIPTPRARDPRRASGADTRAHAYLILARSQALLSRLSSP